MIGQRSYEWCSILKCIWSPTSCASLPRPILHGKEIILCRFFSAANVFGRQSSFLWWSKCKIGIVGWKLIRGRRHKNEMKTSQKILLDLIPFFQALTFSKDYNLTTIQTFYDWWKALILYNLLWLQKNWFKQVLINSINVLQIYLYNIYTIY